LEGSHRMKKSTLRQGALTIIQQPPPQGAFELGVEFAANAVTCSSPNCLKSVEGSHPEDVA
jgi:hypothetical protein